jgi:hypothetical protein
MTKSNLNEELMNQIRLIKYDRSKSIFEQTTSYERQLEKQYGDPDWIESQAKQRKDSKLKYESTKCSIKEEFQDTYPSCCKYKNIAVSPEGGNEFLPFDEENGRGFCNYKTGRGYTMIFPADATLIFSNPTIRMNIVESLVNKFNENDYFNLLRRNQGLTNYKLEFNLRTYVNDGIEYSQARYKALVDFFTEIVLKQFPENSIVKVKLPSGRDYYPSLNIIKDKEIFFDWFYDVDGKIYEMAELKDSRSGYQKFIDEWGTWIMLAASIATMIVTWGAGAPLLAIISAYGAEAVIGVAVAAREFEKGENVMGTFTLLFTAIPFLNFSKSFKGVSKSLCDDAIKEIKAAGISESTTEAEMITFVTNLGKEKPETAKLIKQALSMDEITRAELKQQLPEFFKNQTWKNVRNIIESNPELIKSPKFWKSYIGKQFKIMGVLAATNFAVSIFFGKYLNNEQKQKISKLDSIIPKEQQEEFFMNIAQNIDVYENILNEEKIKRLEKIKKNESVTVEKLKEFCKISLQSDLEKNNRQYIELDNTVNVENSLKTNEWLKSNGYVLMDGYNGKWTDVQISDDDDSFWVKPKDEKIGE